MWTSASHPGFAINSVYKCVLISYATVWFCPTARRFCNFRRRFEALRFSVVLMVSSSCERAMFCFRIDGRGKIVPVGCKRPAASLRLIVLLCDKFECGGHVVLHATVCFKERKYRPKSIRGANRPVLLELEWVRLIGISPALSPCLLSCCYICVFAVVPSWRVRC